MAKEIQATEVKKGKAKFKLEGKAILNDYSISLNNESKTSDWIYNSLRMKVKTKDGNIDCEMSGGYGSERKNTIRVLGKKEDGSDDYKDVRYIDWDDRFDEDVLEGLGKGNFVTVKLEKENGKLVTKNFLSEYDAVEYINEHLISDMIVRVNGDLSYEEYNGNTYIKKKISSISLVEKLEEDKFKSEWVQTVYVTNDTVGKPNKETRTVDLDVVIVDFRKDFNDEKIVRMVNGVEKNGCNVPIARLYELEIGEDVDKVKKMVKKHFTPKKGKVNQVDLFGYFKTDQNLETQQITEDDIPEDIKELIELGMVSKEDFLEKYAFSKGGSNKSNEKMVAKAPNVNFVGDDKIPTIAKVEDYCSEDDLSLESMMGQQKAKFANAEDEYEEEDINTTTEDEEEDDWNFD